MKKLPKGKLYHGSDSLLSVVVGAINDEDMLQIIVELV